MPTYEYIQSAVNRTPRPRSERLRKLGAVVSADFSVTAASSAGAAGATHTHDNLDSLNQITVDDLGYIYLTNTFADDDDAVAPVTVKAKAGYADMALTNADGYTLDWLIPTTVDGVLTLKLNPKYAALWADGDITAGGVGSNQGGGGSGIDLDRMWQSLTNNTDKPNVTINVAHIPNLEMSKIDGLADAIAAAGSVKSLKVGDSSYYPDSNGVIAIPAYPTSLSSPYALTFGNKTYDGSRALTITAADLGAITEIPKATDTVIGGFQTGYSESGKNYAVKMSGNKAYVNVPWTDTVYSLPLAENGTRGGIQIGYSENGKNYAVKLSSEKAYVYVPWTDTVYTHPSNGANTTITAADGRVLSAITVNSLGHVTSVGSKTLTVADIPDLSSKYLPLTGGTLTGDLRLKTGGGNYGSTLRFGDGDYVYLKEDTDDHLSIYAASGLAVETGSSYGINLNSNVTLASAKSFTLGDGILTWDSDVSSWKLSGNLYATGFITSGGVNSNGGAIIIDNDVQVASSKTVTLGNGVLSWNQGWRLGCAFYATALIISVGTSVTNVGTSLSDINQTLSTLSGTVQNHEQRISALEA